MRPCRAERRPVGGFGSVSVSTSRIWMWSLTLGCIAGSVWSSSSSARYTGNSMTPAGRPVASTSYAYSEQDSHVLHSAPVSVYRSSASLRSGHGESLTPNLLTRYPELLSSCVKLIVSCLLSVYQSPSVFHLLLTSFSQSCQHTWAIERTLWCLHSFIACCVLIFFFFALLFGWAWLDIWKHAFWWCGGVMVYSQNKGSLRTQGSLYTCYTFSMYLHLDRCM